MCHCSDCLKISGRGWGASAAHANKLDWLTKARPRGYRSSDWAERGSCSECGSQIFYRIHDRPLISIALGAFDSSVMLSVAGQIFRSLHPAWGPVGGEIADLENGWGFERTGLNELV